MKHHTSKTNSANVKISTHQLPLLATKLISGPGVPTRTGYGVGGIKWIAIAPAAIKILTIGNIKIGKR